VLGLFLILRDEESVALKVGGDIGYAEDLI
jgi:hypothetical protein